MLITNIPNEMFLQNSLSLECAVKLKTAREISSSVLPCTNLGTAHNDAFTSRDIMNVARLIAEVTITIMTMKDMEKCSGFWEQRSFIHIALTFTPVCIGRVLSYIFS